MLGLFWIGKDIYSPIRTLFSMARRTRRRNGKSSRIPNSIEVRVLKPPIHPAMRDLIREDDRVNREERERRRYSVRKFMLKKKSGQVTSEDIRAAVARYEKGGNIIKKIPPGGPMADKLVADGTIEFPERCRLR